MKCLNHVIFKTSHLYLAMYAQVCRAMSKNRPGDMFLRYLLSLLLNCLKETKFWTVPRSEALPFCSSCRYPLERYSRYPYSAIINLYGKQYSFFSLTICMAKSNRQRSRQYISPSIALDRLLV